MQALQEVTDWEYPNHIYLVDGDRLVAYIKQGEIKPFYFKSGIKGFSKSGRKFKELKTDLFETPKVESNLIAVAGSKGNTYYIDPEAKTCTCSGFTFRGTCKHIKELELA